MHNFPKLWLAVDKKAVMVADKEYNCPTGYDWATRKTVQEMMVDSSVPDTEEQKKEKIGSTGLAMWVGNAVKNPGVRYYYAYQGGWCGC